MVGIGVLPLSEGGTGKRDDSNASTCGCSKSIEVFELIKLSTASNSPLRSNDGRERERESFHAKQT
jgi:hypothetical protein